MRQHRYDDLIVVRYSFWFLGLKQDVGLKKIPASATKIVLGFALFFLISAQSLSKP